MEAISVRELLEAVGGTLIGPEADLEKTISRVDTDSRNIHPGSLFIPLVGERFDGHAYINSALEGGAAGCFTARERESYREDCFYIKVGNSQRALRDLAAWYKDRFPIPFVGVTGSVGKTTAKDMIAAVLGVKYKVLKTEGNFNNNVGLPLTLLRLDRTHQIGVLEMGMDKFGEIDYLGEIVQPEVGIITNIGDAHIEKLGSRENIFKAKCELLPHIRKENGLLILNADDPMLAALRGKTPVKTVFCGKSEQAEYQAQVTGGDGVSHIHCRLTTPAMEREIKIPAVGEHMIYPTLIAAAVGEHFGLTVAEIEKGVDHFVPTRLRMNLVQRGRDITILDDTYNANPQSMRAAIRVLADSHSTWKAAVLGDMFELGPYSPALHTEVGECLGKQHIHCLVAVGDEARHIAQGAKSAGVECVYYCKDKAEAKAVLPEIVQPDSTILVKASRGMKMEELVERLVELTPEG